MVFPSSLIPCVNSKTSYNVLVSNAPIGLAAINTYGFEANAIAIVTSRIWLPESSLGDVNLTTNPFL